MLYNSSNTQNAVTTVPAITYLFVGITSFVLAYFTAMDKGEETETMSKDESTTSMLPGFGAMTPEYEKKETGDETTEPPVVEAEPISETESETNTPPAPLAGGKKRKNSIKKQIKKTTSKRSTKSRST
jgi:hypothetical protein